MENNNFKKLALMGLAGGLLFVGAEANADESSNQVKELLGNVSLNGNFNTILAAGCGGAPVPHSNQQPYHTTVQSGCSGKAYNEHGQETGPSSEQTQRASQGCGAAKPQPNYANARQNNGATNNNEYYYTDADQDWSKENKVPAESNKKNGYIAENEMMKDTKVRETKVTEYSTVAAKSTQAERDDFVSQLSAQGKVTFQSLTPEGKDLAIQHSKQNPTLDKNQAVKEAAAKMVEKRNGVLNKSMSH